jgi:HK97 gp10 family phage protein
MGSNPSVRQFKTDMQDLVNRAKQDLHQTLILQANEVAENIRSAAPVRTGNLRKSIRVRDVSTADQTKLSVLVIGGGSLTTKRENSGPHDYSLSTEFGTVKERAEPFFFSTFRLYQQHGLDQFKETFEQTIEANNQIRAARASNYSNSGASISVSQFGAVVVPKGRI